MDEVGRDEEGPPRVGTEGGIVKRVGQGSLNKNEKRCSRLISFVFVKERAVWWVCYGIGLSRDASFSC